MVNIIKEKITLDESLKKKLHLNLVKSFLIVYIKIIF